ncbi:hypothetical protein [uncultured Psychrobacter sp.]|uniref:hypothetical protein n=1 Tax=uncultured Psychrobacter sp. TaxID=259303 RepID=UPI0030D94EF9
MSDNTVKTPLDFHFDQVKPHIIRALKNISVGRVSTDIKFQDRPYMVMEGNSIDNFFFEHILETRLNSDDIEIVLPLTLKVSQRCLLDRNESELKYINVINSFDSISINHDLYDEGGFSITVFNGSLISFFNNALGETHKNGFVKGEPLDFGRNLSEKNPSDYLFFVRLVAEISSLLKGEITPLNFKLFTAFKEHNYKGVEIAMSNFTRLLAQMNNY